ncbi:HlyD family efflux transporter periplasmic adaptor subunit [Rhodobacteraceae bacterium N5(2021)]|uniref:HlyD family efflux transporter periplasmic adaptor subunit n=1 Tax=Gymnodinialimonas phycosphaerae TaxID=2841589 RepID=A0A975TV44_9RHOB|nr:HlyD family efflux transporter periplasmic adaptor subunit [Gymnodinialimonas phycosphaerae]MBY4891234.1 HlyD family efflux transporter periplasmic adaptor subunit [Gymnodinialimonas phycosphaerae]
MAKAKKRSRLILTAVTVLLVAGALTAAFWPQPTMVDMGVVTRGTMQLTIDEEGRTRVRDAYIVSTPVAGQLQRVRVQPGDPVVRGETIVAHMRPTNPAALDVRTREQAQAVVTAAEAALRVARADLNAALANRDLADTELSRAQQLLDRGIVSQAALDSARQSARVAQANVDTSEAAIAMREAEIANAQAQLIGFDDPRLAAAIGTSDDDIPLYAPTDGRILRVIQESETSLPAGAPILEIGNIESDLEVVVELLSTDAVQVEVGDPVIIADWGGPTQLAGEVTRVDPFGVTQFSALGVEEQRVNAVITFSSPPEDYAGLGHGFRVETRIVVWQEDETLIVPASALFRSGETWAVFLVVDGTAQLRPIEIGPNNGIQAQVTGGLSENDRVILYPSSGLSEGMNVAERVVN